MSDQSGEYESSEYETSEQGGTDNDDWISGSTIEARVTDLQTFSGSLDVDISGLPESPEGESDGDTDNDDNVA